jgi:predicted enzyme related to lactoylglutathione lyase
MVDTKDKGITGGIGVANGDAPAMVTFYVEVEDLQATLDKAVKLGGKITHSSRLMRVEWVFQLK